MINKCINSLKRRKGSACTHTLPNENHYIKYTREQHSISRRDISPNALKVLYRLNKHDYQAYLVGGCIRDLLLETKPKDFDIATDATPEQVKALFRNSRIIGRRFKLIHIVFNKETIEVATFRASHKPESHGVSHLSQHSSSGRILRDNVYGSLEDDAKKRDFTINALYYTIQDFSIRDFSNGMDDLNNRLIRIIGQPAERYHEDPVRMLRTIRFAVKLHFKIEKNTALPIRDKATLLYDIPPARLFEEIIKLFLNGNATATFLKLKSFNLLEPLLPITYKSLIYSTNYKIMLNHALKNTDQRVRNSQSVTPAFLFAVFLWEGMRKRTQELITTEQMPPVIASQKATAEIIVEQCRRTAIPQRFSAFIRETWDMQRQLEKRNPKQVESIAEKARFRAAYDFLLLREQSGENTKNSGVWWTDFQKASSQQKQQMISNLRIKSRRNPSKI